MTTAAQFFYEHAGYAYDPAVETVEQGRQRGAERLAAAEAWLQDSDLEFVTRDDDETAYCYCDDPDCQYHEGSETQWETVVALLVRPCPQHGLDCRHAETVEALSGIMAPTREYLRVVRAELALEAMAVAS